MASFMTSIIFMYTTLWESKTLEEWAFHLEQNKPCSALGSFYNTNICFLCFFLFSSFLRNGTSKMTCLQDQTEFFANEVSNTCFEMHMLYCLF